MDSLSSPEVVIDPVNVRVSAIVMGTLETGAVFNDVVDQSSAVVASGKVVCPQVDVSTSTVDVSVTGFVAIIDDVT